MFGYDYEGEVDENSKACGIGVARHPNGETIEGTFCNNLMHGICE